jgi:hypothetical protein
VGFVVENVALEEVFSEYFGLPCQFSFHLLLHTRHLSSGAGTIGQLVSLHTKKIKKKYIFNKGREINAKERDGHKTENRPTAMFILEKVSCQKHRLWKLQRQKYNFYYYLFNCNWVLARWQ